MAVLGVAALGIGGWTAWQSWSARQAVLQDQRTLAPASANVDALLTAFVDEETGERGYLITSNASFLQPYHKGLAAAPRLMDELRHELAGRTGDLADLSLVDARYRGWSDRVAQPEIADVMRGRASAAIAIERAGVGKSHFDRLRAGVATLQSAVARQTSAAQSQADGVLQTAFSLAVIRAVVVVALLVVALMLLGRWVIRPVDRLAAEVRAVADGDLDRPIGGDGPLEVASLGADVEAMRRRLRDETDEGRQLREALAERSPLQVLLHSELLPSLEVTAPAAAGRLVPAEGVLAGDWYDVLRTETGTVAAAAVDISGHGAGAGLFALKLKHLLTPVMRAGIAPGEAIGRAAAECGETEEQFATGIVVEIDPSGRRCRYANAGHPSGLLFREGRIEAVLGTTGPIMCALPGSWRTEEMAIEPDDLLVLVTDGVLEARRPDGSAFGIEGVAEAVRRQLPGADPETVVEGIVSALRGQCRFPLKDDATVAVLLAAPMLTAQPAG